MYFSDYIKALNTDTLYILPTTAKEISDLPRKKTNQVLTKINHAN